MSSHWERKLFEMAGKEQMVVPKSLDRKIEQLLSAPGGLKGETAPKPRLKRRAVFKKAIVLAAAMTMLFSITVAAAVGAYRQRMEAMNQEKLEEYFRQIYDSKLPADNYNRPYYESERDRIKELSASYEAQGLFPEGELIMLDQAEDYTGKKIGFLKDTSTFFFPEKEMSDEELLQIIDFTHKRDYSLEKMNEMIAAGEAEALDETSLSKMPEEVTEPSVLQSDAVTDPEQELTILYTGDLPLLSMAAGNDCIFLAGWNEVHRMEIGSSDSELFFDEFDRRTKVTALCQDEKGNVYLGLMQQKEDGTWESGLWVLNAEGSFLREIDLSPYMSLGGITMAGEKSNGFIRHMAVDENGLLYLRGAGFQDAGILLILDGDGNLVSRIEEDEYRAGLTCGIGVGRDKRVYTAIFDREHRLGIAAVNPEEGRLEDISMGIVPEDTVSFDLVAKGYDADFVLWGYSGIFSYNMGEESAVCIMPAWETPCDVEGTLCCVLPDGRIVLAACPERKTVTDTNGTKLQEWVPEKTCFYYLPGLRR